MSYYRYNEKNEFVGVTEVEPNDVYWTNTPYVESFLNPKLINDVWVEGATQEEISLINSQTLAISKYLDGDYRSMQLDNLVGIRRASTLSDKGLKGEKKYYFGGELIWSSEKKYWFEENAPNPNGFVRIIKLFNVDGSIGDTWSVSVDLSEDDKQAFQKERRTIIFEYFKSQQPDLFNLLYTFFSKEINDYIMIGGTVLNETLTWAKDNHPYIGNLPTANGTLTDVPVVQIVLSQEIPTQSGGTTTVLQGILDELI